MVQPEHEHTLNVWLADLLRKNHGIDARQEQRQAGGGWMDVEVHIGPVKIALEAEQGQSAAKKREAIGDADRKLRRRNADCAIAVCYPDGIASQEEIADSRMLWTIRNPNNLVPADRALWSDADLSEMASIIKLAPMQLGNPDLAAVALSASLDRAVGRLSEAQKREIARSLDLPQGKSTRLAGQSSSRWNQAAKRAMLVVTTAMMFHSRLDSHRNELRPEFDSRQPEGTPFVGAWPPMMAQQCVKDTDPVGAFDGAWDLWLAVDYKPIFATAQSALNGCPHDSAFTAAIRETGEAALALTRDISGLRHDLLGRIFHTVLDTARYDGSFYTTTAAATLLASLAITDDMCDWSDPESIAKLRVTDPACGTGTLLMAAAERIRDLSPGSRDDSTMAQALIEEVLAGYDVNLTATHMAATTLGLLSPTTRFKNMKIGRAFLGVDDSGIAYLGSLEFLDQQPKMMAWPGAVQAVSQIESGERIVQADPADLVIMNPPFTRDSLRHDQFSKADERKIKAREKQLFANKPVHLSSNGNAFIVLADFIRKREQGTIAAILPLVTTTNASARDIRLFLGRDYHVETIVVSHDPERIYFSENTSIGEILIVCRLWADSSQPKPPTRVVKLVVNPSTPTGAVSVAQAIANDSLGELGMVQEWPASRIASGDWGAVQFLSPYLCNQFIELKEGRLFDSVQLSDFAEVGPEGRRIRDAFVKSSLPDAEAREALWKHDAGITQSMAAKPDTYITAKPSKVLLAKKYWEQRGRFLLPARVRLNTVRTLAVRLDNPVSGSAWVPCRLSLREDDAELTEKALCVYLNSTIGILALLGNRSIRIPSYSQFSLDNLRNLIVPGFDEKESESLRLLSEAYDSNLEASFLPLQQMDSCNTRRALDDAVCAALGLDAELVSTVRRQLAAEPSVTGKRYAGPSSLN